MQNFSDDDATASSEVKISRKRLVNSKKDTLILIGNVKKETIEWLWRPYIPLGRLTMLGGDPGVGKSFITTALASTLSRGESFPGEEENIREPMKVIMLNAEDDPADTIRPRLESMNANLFMIYISQEDIELSKVGLEDIRDMVRRAGAKLLIIDPIVAFLGPKMNMNQANEVRHIMKGLAKLARDLNIAILIVRHNRKEGAGAPTKAIYAGIGSIDFTAAVRSELAVNESKNGMKFLNHIKTNAGKKGQSLTYTITSADDGSPMFAWGDFTAWPPKMGLGGKTISKKFKGEAQIAAWLYDLLKSNRIGLPSNDVYSMGKLMGFTEDKIKRVKPGLAVSEKHGDGWYWKLADDAKPPVDPDDKPVLG